MLHLITGTPGAKKTAFTVSKLDKIERDNKVNLVKNKKYYEHNLPLIEKFKSDFSYYDYEVGSGHEIRTEIDVLDDDYFDMFTQDFDDLRPDDYYLRATRFNEICERINQREGVQGFKGLLPVRTIYTNIKALKIDYVRALTYDWRECPDGSIIVIDEVQLVEPYDNLKDKNNPIIQDLTIHRHRGFDFYFITQFPLLLHPTVKVLIGVHYHLTVPYGYKTKVYQYGSTRDRPDTASNKFTCETKFNFSPPDRIFKLYKSTTINTHKKRLPYKQLAFFGVLILCPCAIFIYGLTGASNSSLVNHDKEFDTVVSTDDKKTIVHDDVDNPLSQSDIQIQQTPEQYELTRVAMVMSSSTNCRAYNSYGHLLDIDQSQCFSYSDDPSTIPQSMLKHTITYDNFGNLNNDLQQNKVQQIDAQI